MRLLRLLLPLVLLGAAPAPKQAHPAIWALSDEDTTIWLLGTIHVLPSGYRWRDEAIDKAVTSAERLTLEVVPDADPQKLAGLLLSLGRGEGLPPLAARVPAEKRAALAEMVAESGFPAELLDGMKSWAAGVVLTGVALRRIDGGLASQAGVEAQLAADFRGRARPVDGLETAEQQLGFFDGLPEAVQRRFLAAALESPDQAKAEFDEMLAAWTKGDVDGIARAFAKDPEFTPELRDVLIRRRNAAWAEALAKRLARPGASLVAVGAGHLAGPGSVIELLKARGLRVRRAE